VCVCVCIYIIIIIIIHGISPSVWLSVILGISKNNNARDKCKYRVFMLRRNPLVESTSPLINCTLTMCTTLGFYIAGLLAAERNTW